MHYKSEKKHSKKTKKLPKRMKQESFFDDALESRQDQYLKDPMVPGKSLEDYPEKSRPPKRMRPGDAADFGSNGQVEGQGNQKRTSPKHIDSETDEPSDHRIPKRMKADDRIPDSGASGYHDIITRKQGEVLKSVRRTPVPYADEEPDETDGVQAKYSYQRREKPAKRNVARKRISGAWIILICLVFLFLVSLLAWDIFSVSKVQINGLTHMPYTDVVALSGIKYNQNIFLVDFESIKNSIETNPILEVIDIHRTLPSTITIDIFERKAVAVLSYIGRTMVMDKDCNVVGISDQNISDAMIIIKGAEIKDYKLGQSVILQEEDKLWVLQELLTKFEEHGISQYLSEIDLENVDYITLRSSMGLKISIGSIRNLDNKCMWINARVPEMHSNGEVAGTLHITDNNTAYYNSGQ